MSEKNVPTNPELWKKVQKLVRGDVKSILVNDQKIMGPNDGKGFKKHPSAYSNGWAVKKYNELGGSWKTASFVDHSSNSPSFINRIAGRISSLDDWFGKEDWVAIDTTGKIVGPCAQSDKREKETHGGHDPIKCLPRKKAENMTKSERASAARRKKRIERKTPNTKEPAHAKTKV